VVISPELTDFQDRIVGSWTRDSHRDAALRYVTGLLRTGPKRRSTLRGIQEAIDGDRALYERLQGFLVDATWDPVVVMRGLARYAAESFDDIQAWMFTETVVPKRGDKSPGVALQYSPASGRQMNCQRVISLHAVGRRRGRAVSLPVGWSMFLPHTWLSVPEHLAQVPAEVHRTHFDSIRYGCWRSRLLERVRDALDRAGLSEASPWKSALHAPVVSDRLYVDEVDECEDDLRRIEDVRGLSFVLPVPRHSVELSEFEEGTVVMQPFGANHETRLALRWRIPHADGWYQPERARNRSLLAEWPLGVDRPSGYWLVGGPLRQSPSTPMWELGRCALIPRNVDLGWEQLRELGIDDYEGRSLSGWHRHCALVSLAYAYKLEQQRG
jgi:hypothetical protein